MNNYEEKSKQLQETNFNNRVFKELSLLIKHGILDKETISSTHDYEMISGYEYRLEYRFYKHRERPVYAFITKADESEKNSLGFTIYELDYAKPELVQELVQHTKEESKSRTDLIVKALNIIGVILCVLGVFGSLFVLEEGFIYFLGTLASFGVTALFFFALAAILIHLKSIDEKLTPKE